jgi:hypothetical protein
MAVWLYAASRAKASDSDTLSLACDSGFIWRPFYNRNGVAIACAKQIQARDTLLLGYRGGGSVRLLGRFRVGKPDQPIDACPVFGTIPVPWRNEFQKHGYTADPIVNDLVGIFVEECEPLSGRLAYANQNTLSRLGCEYPLPRAQEPPVKATRRLANLRVDDPVTQPSSYAPISANFSKHPLAVRDGVHIGIDVGGRCEKGFDLCITEWVTGVLHEVQWKRLPHTRPVPPTCSLRHLIRDGDIAGLARETQASASATAEILWGEIEKFDPAAIHIDSPSAFSRNRLGHGRRCEKRSLIGVSLQSTPSIACTSEHGGDWGWLVYGMIAFASCLHRGGLSNEDWVKDLSIGMNARFNSTGTVLRECFPTATISVLRERNRSHNVEVALAKKVSRPEVDAVIAYLKHGVAAVKRPTQSIYDRADALVAALGALPHISHAFHETAHCGMHGRNWNGTADDEQIEGTFLCVE